MLRHPRASSVERNVHRRRPAILRSQVETRGSRPTPPSRVNGCSWYCSGPEHLLAPSAAVRIGDPIRPLARPRSFRDAINARRRELLPCHRPTRHNACPQSSPCSSALLSKRGTASGVDSSVPGTAPLPVVPLRQGDRCARAPSCPCGPALARPSRSPPTSSAPTPPSSPDDLRGWVVPGVSSADLGLTARRPKTRCLSLS
jgi:hypothetical protein